MRRRPHLIPAIIASVMLIGALADNPYGYYCILRLVVCATALVVLYAALCSEQLWALWTFGIVALLFNPLLPIHLTREIWAVLDLGTAGLLLASIFAVARPKAAKPDEGE